MAYSAFPFGDCTWSPGYSSPSPISTSLVVHVYDQYTSSNPHVQALQGLDICRPTGELPHSNQCYMPVGNDLARLGCFVNFPALNTTKLGFLPQTEYVDNRADQINERTCSSCKQQRTEILNRQVCELVRRHGCLEVAGKEILAWYMMLSAEDRKIIKESGPIAEFLQDNPSLLVADNWVRLKDSSVSRNMEKSAANGQDFNKANQSAFYCVWTCEACGISNCFESSTCRKCHRAIRQPEGSSFAGDDSDLEASDYTTESHFYSFSACDSVEDNTKKNMGQTQNTDKKGACPKGIVKSNSTGEQCSSSLSSGQLMSKTSRHGKAYAISEKKEIHMDLEQSLETGSGEKQNHSANNLVFGEPSGPGLMPFDNLKKSGFQECINIVSDNWEAFEDCGFTEGENMMESSELYLSIKEANGDLGLKENTLQNYLSGINEKPVNQDCSASDICDDTFFSIQSGSNSNSLSNFSLDELTDVEQCYFEEASEEISHQDLNNPSKNIETCTSCKSIDSCCESFTIYQSKEIKNKMVTKSVNTDMTSLDKPFLVEWRKNNQRNESCNTDLSWLPNKRNHKGSQTMSVKTKDISVNTDAQLYNYYQTAQNSVNRTYGNHSGEENRKGYTQGLSSASIEAVTQRAVKAELQLLDTQRWLCLQLCWNAHQQCMEKQCVLSVSGAHLQQRGAIAPFDLQSVLSEVEEIYERIKEKILSGVPLDTLTPLSMQLTKVEIPADSFLSRCLSCTFQKSAETSPNHKGDQKQKNKTQNPANSSLCSETPYHLTECKGSSKGSDVSDNWFDAQENLTVNCPSEMLGSVKELGKTEGNHSLEISDTVKQTESLSKEPQCFYVHVGNIGHTITEAQLTSYFKKYQISQVFLQELSIKSSYAVLTFSSSAQAQAAVREMDGKEICGRKLKVRAIKDSQYNVTMAFQALNQQSESPRYDNTQHAIVVPAACSAQLYPKNSGSSPIQSVGPQNVSGYENVPGYGAQNMPGPETVSAILLTPPKFGTSAPQPYVWQAPPATPLWLAPGSPNIMPSMPPWMMQSFLASSLQVNSLQNPWYTPYSGPPCSLATSPQGPWCPFPLQASYVQAKPMQNRHKGTMDTSVKPATFSYSKAVDVCVPSGSVGPVCANSSSGLSSIVRGSVQTNSASLNARNKMPFSNTNSETVTEQGKVLGPVSNFPRNMTPSRTTSPAFGQLSVKDTLRGPPAVPIKVTTTTNVTASTVTAKVSPSISDTVTQAVQIPFNLTSAVPLRVPSFVPTSVNIPSSVTSESSSIVTPTVPTSSTACPRVSAKASSVFSNTSSSVAVPVSFSFAPKPTNPVLKKSPLPCDEDSEVYPKLDLSSELPTHIIPNRLNFSSFNKVMDQLTTLHPDASSEQITGTLQEIRISRGGFLSGLSIREIVKKASFILAKKTKEADVRE